MTKLTAKPFIFEVHQAHTLRNKSKWYYILKSGNGEVIMTSEMYVSKYNAKRAVNNYIKKSGIKFFKIVTV